MPTCNNYFGKVFAHLSAAIAVAGVSAEFTDIGDAIYGDSSVLIKSLGNLAILIGLLFGVLMTKPGGIPKYVLFILFAFWVGQVMKPYVTLLEDKSVLTRTLILTSGVFLGMMTLGFYDSMNLLGFGPYLLAGLLGLIVTQALILTLGTPEEKEKGLQWLNLVGVAIFAIYTAYDVQVLRLKAATCKKMQKILKKDPDYPAEGLALFLDFANLFLYMGRGN